MRLYFKMRDIENVDIEEQKKFIHRYVTDYCHFENCGVEVESFIEHTIEDSLFRSRSFVVGSYLVKEDADFERIQLKMRLFNVHSHFVIFMLFS